MTTQPKPRLPLSEADRQMLTYLSDANSSARVAIALDSSLRAALAEVKKLRNELATTSKGSMTVEKMQEQLAQVTAERDKWKGDYADHDEYLHGCGNLLGAAGIQMAEGAHDGITTLINERDEYKAASEKHAQIYTDSAKILEAQLLASAAENVLMRDALEKVNNGGLPDGVLGNVTERMLAMCEIAREALAAYDDALGKGKV